MKTLHGLQGQSLGFHFLIVSLNPARDSFTFISGGGGGGGGGLIAEFQVLNTTQIQIHYKHRELDVP